MTLPDERFQGGAMLRSKRKYAILIIFIVAAILTPPDVVTQLMMAGPLLLLYELSVWIAKVFGRKPVDVQDKEASANGHRA